MSDADRLKKLYEERVPTGMSLVKFGETYGIGSKAMVWQYLTGYRPLNFEAAAKFARGLRCTIADISPDLARKLKADIFPVLGKVSLKASLILGLLVPPLVPSKSDAAPFNIIKSGASFSRAISLHTTHCLRWLRNLVRKFTVVHS